MAGLWIVGRDMPREASRIAPRATGVDRFGLPTPTVAVTDHPDDAAMREHPCAQEDAAHAAAGAGGGPGTAPSLDPRPRGQPHERAARGRGGEPTGAGA